MKDAFDYPENSASSSCAIIVNVHLGVAFADVVDVSGDAVLAIVALVGVDHCCHFLRQLS